MALGQLLSLSFLLTLILGATCGTFALLSKKEDVAWSRYLIAGPMVFIRPAEYLKARRIRALMWMLTASLAVFLATVGLALVTAVREQ